MSDQIVYKILSASELQQMRRDGVFHGSPVVIADGYIHLSCASQVAATLDKHFSGVDGLVLAAVDLSGLGDTVHWEASRDGQLFPHIYGLLPVEAVVSVAPLERTPDGTVKLPVTDAQFRKSGDVRDFWTERLVTRDEEVVLTWYDMGEPFLVHTQPNAVPGRPYGMCTVLVPALGARLTHNGIEAQGRPWPRQREGRPSSTCVLGLCESWTEAR